MQGRSGRGEERARGVWTGIGVALAVAFVVLTWLVTRGVTDALDEAVGRAFGADAHSNAIAVMELVSLLGSELVLVPVVVATLFAAWRRGDRRGGVVTAAVVGGALVVNLLLKWLFGRPRPEPLTGIVLPLTHAYPSGHAAASVVVYGMCAMQLARLYPRVRLPAALLAILLAAMIGFSRVYLGVHWPTDVVGGWLFGALVLCAGHAMHRRRTA